MRDRFRVESASGRAADLIGRAIGAPIRPSVWTFDVAAPALVVGRFPVAVDEAEAARAGIDVVGRASGGAAVLLVPGHHLWVDIVVPAGDPLWDDDVGRATHWVGDAWAAALGTLGQPATVHQGAMRHTKWSRHVCFAGLGPGEVVDGDGRKIVGISQRRTRLAAFFQCVAHSDLDVDLLGHLTDVPAGALDAAAPVRVDLDDLRAALVAAVSARRAHMNC